MAWYDRDDITKNADGTYSQTFNRDGSTVTWKQDASGKLIEKTVKPGTTAGLKESNTESRKNTTYHFNDGKSYTGRESDWREAAKKAGNTSGLRQAISYPDYVTDKGARSFLEDLADYYGVDLAKPNGGTDGGKASTWQEAISKGLIPDYDVPFGRPGESAATREQQIADIDALIRNFDIGAKPEYSSEWDSIKEELARKALGMRYDDWVQGDQYKALADRYGHSGKMAMEDVMGQIASRTGGLASSYAATAATQQYNEYMSKLEEAAMDMFANERNNAIQDASLAYGYADSDYNRYLDELGQYNNDRSFAYNAYQDALAQDNYLKEREYEREQNDYSKGQTSRSEAQDRINSYLAAGGKVADLDRDLLALSGLTEGELLAQERYYAQKNAKKSSRSGSSAADGYMDYESLFADAKASGNPQSFIANRYKDYGFDKSGGLYSDYKSWSEGQDKADKDAARKGNGSQGYSNGEAEVNNRTYKGKDGQTWYVINGTGYSESDIRNKLASGKMVIEEAGLDDGSYIIKKR